MTNRTTKRSGDATQSPAAKSKLLLAAIDLLSEGVGVFDRHLRLVACDARFSELRGYPAKLCKEGGTADGKLAHRVKNNGLVEFPLTVIKVRGGAHA